MWGGLYKCFYQGVYHYNPSGFHSESSEFHLYRNIPINGRPHDFPTRRTEIAVHDSTRGCEGYHIFGELVFHQKKQLSLETLKIVKKLTILIFNDKSLFYSYPDCFDPASPPPFLFFSSTNLINFHHPPIFHHRHLSIHTPTLQSIFAITP